MASAASLVPHTDTIAPHTDTHTRPHTQRPHTMKHEFPASLMLKSLVTRIRHACHGAHTQTHTRHCCHTGRPAHYTKRMKLQTSAMVGACMHPHNKGPTVHLSTHGYNAQRNAWYKTSTIMSESHYPTTTITLKHNTFPGNSQGCTSISCSQCSPMLPLSGNVDATAPQDLSTPITRVPAKSATCCPLPITLVPSSHAPLQLHTLSLAMLTRDTGQNHA